MVLEVLVSVSHFAATTPAIVVVCLGATLFLCGIVAVTTFFYRRKSSPQYRKSGVYLTSRSPIAEEIPLRSQLLVRRKSDVSVNVGAPTCGGGGGRTPHLVMKKSPSPPLHYASPKNISPVTPPTEEGGNTTTTTTTTGGSRRINRGSIAIQSNPICNAATFCELHGSTKCTHQHQHRSSNHLVKRENSKSPRTSPQISPSTSTPANLGSGSHHHHIQHEVMINQNQRNGNSNNLTECSTFALATTNSNTITNTTSATTAASLVNAGLGLFPITSAAVASTSAGVPSASTAGPLAPGTAVPVLSSSAASSPSSSSVTSASSRGATTTESLIAGGTAVIQKLTGGGQNDLGILHFKLRYKEEKGTLVVTVVKCEDLPVKDTALMTCDPYVKLQLLPEKQQRVKTRVLRHTREPVYEEDFTFYGVQPNQLQEITLHFVILSFDRYSRDDVIGEAFYPLEGLDITTAENSHLDIAMDIQPRNFKIQTQGRGEVLLSLCWQPTANRLTVVVLKARNLPKMDVTGLADPYVKLYLFYDGQRLVKKKTHVKKRTLNPVFNESFVFDLPPAAAQATNLDKVSLQVLLLDWDRVTKNEVIGRLELGSGASAQTAQHHWNEVLNCPRRQIAEWHKLKD